MNRRPPKPSGKKRKLKKSRMSPGKVLKYSFLILFISFLIAAAYQYRHGILYYLSFKTDKQIESLTEEKQQLADVRIYEILSRHKDKVFGFDVSHYQGKIQWNSIERNAADYPMQFVFIRATAGKNVTDYEFKRNWKQAKANGFIRGAYHYYRPNENSLKQAKNFIKNVKLQKGDLPPVLDIEQLPRKQSIDSLKVGLKRWLDKVEGHYGIKPIIYSGESYYTDFLKKEFTDYKLWIANYSFFEEEIREEWQFWQFTDKASLKGIDGNVDVNIYNGSREDLLKLVKI